MNKIITIVTRDLTYGGGGVYTQKLIEWLLKKGYAVNLISPNNIFGDKVTFIRAKLIGKYFITRELFFFFYARYLLKKFSLTDTIILSQHNLFSYGLENVILFKHSTHKGHLKSLLFEPRNIKNVLGIIFHFLYQFLDYLSFYYAKKIIYISKMTYLEIISKINGKFTKKVIYLPNVIDTSKPSKVSKIYNSKIILFYVGRLELSKGILDLCKILDSNYNELILKFGEFSLVVAGEGYLQVDIQKFKFVDYRGNVSRGAISDLYSSSDILVLPSYYENCPTVILEAMLYGNLILSRKVGDVEYMIRNQSEQLFESNDEIITQLINILELNDESVLSLITKNRDSIKEYDLDSVFNRLLINIYE